jgi:VWFA-related protein
MFRSFFFMPFRSLLRVCFWATVAAALSGCLAVAQSAPAQQQDTANQQQQQSQQQTKPASQAPAEAGGPTGDTGPIAIPKKTTEAEPETVKPRPAPDKKPEFTITKDVPLVTLDVSVLTKDGHFVPGLKRDMFKVMEDGVPQQVTNFSQSEAPITAVLLVEFANKFYGFVRDMWIASYSFAQTLRKDDWIAVVSYDMKPEIQVDFTQDKRAVYAAINQLRIPGFSETNMFDAVYDTLDRVDGIEGRKYIILVSSGCDSFSKMTLDKTLQKIKATPNTTIYAVGTGQALRLWAESHGLLGYLTCTTGGAPSLTPEAMSTEFAQADNQLSSFARMTGGKAYFPRFDGEFPDIFRDIASNIRNQYTLAYHPTNSKLDGSYRKLKVELVGPDGKPLKIHDEKGKEVKYQIVARQGYTAKHIVD